MLDIRGGDIREEKADEIWATFVFMLPGHCNGKNISDKEILLFLIKKIAICVSYVFLELILYTLLCASVCHYLSTFIVLTFKHITQC